MIEYSDDNPVYVLADFLPPLDETVAYLYKYKDDLAYHYEREFYNLALFSYHQLYMAVLHMYLLKFHRMDIKIAGACRQNHPVISVLTPSFYSDITDEKARIGLFGRRISAEVKKKHVELVQQRDRVAHFTGDVLTKEQIDKYVTKSIDVLNEIQTVAFYEMLLHSTDVFGSQVNEILIETDKNERFYKISNLIQDFYLSKNDIDLLRTKNQFMFFAEYISECGYDPIEN